MYKQHFDNFSALFEEIAHDGLLQDMVLECELTHPGQDILNAIQFLTVSNDLPPKPCITKVQKNLAENTTLVPLKVGHIYSWRNILDIDNMFIVTSASNIFPLKSLTISVITNQCLLHTND